MVVKAKMYYKDKKGNESHEASSFDMRGLRIFRLTSLVNLVINHEEDSALWERLEHCTTRELGQKSKVMTVLKSWDPEDTGIHLCLIEQARISAFEQAHNSALEQAYISALEQAHISVLEQAHNSAFEQAHISAFEQAHISVLEQAHISAFEQAHISALEQAYHTEVRMS